jgi:hypothetical protein
LRELFGGRRVSRNKTVESDVMKQTVVAAANATWRGLRFLGRGLRRGVVATVAAIAMVVIYGLGTIGSYGLTLAGISSAALVTSATKADAHRRRWRGRRRWRRRRRRRGWWWGRRRRRRRWRRRRWRGPYIYFGW